MPIPIKMAVGFVAGKVAVLVYMERYFGERSHIASKRFDEALAYIDERIAEWESTDGAKRLFARPMLKRLRALRAEVADAESGVHPSEILNTRLDVLYREVRGTMRSAGLAAGTLATVTTRFFGGLARDMGTALEDVYSRISREEDHKRQ